MLVKESNSASSLCPLSTDKSTKIESVVSAETVVSCNCDGVVASGPTGGSEEHSSWNGLIWMSRLNGVAYAAAADVVRCCCSMEELWATEKNVNLCVERIFGRCKKVPWLNGLFNIYIQVPTRISYYVALVHRENLMNVGNHRHKNVVSGSVLCRHDLAELAESADIWLSGQHVANMLATLPAKEESIGRGNRHMEGGPV